MKQAQPSYSILIGIAIGGVIIAIIVGAIDSSNHHASTDSLFDNIPVHVQEVTRGKSYGLTIKDEAPGRP